VADKSAGYPIIGFWKYSVWQEINDATALDNSNNVMTEQERCRSSCLYVCGQENEKQDAFQSNSQALEYFFT
jgi:hypothetical protein